VQMTGCKMEVSLETREVKLNRAKFRAGMESPNI